jgi:site-specific recombinase XerD
VQTGLLTGFRRQEVVSLRPEDIDLARKTVSVAACYAKNGESRPLPIGTRLNAVLDEALTQRGHAPTVFVKDSGDPWTPSAFAHAFAVACRRAGVETLHPHVLRHTFASRLVMAGVDIRTVQELMGHKDIDMTLRYAHLSPNHKQAAMKMLEDRFPAKSPANFHDKQVIVPTGDSTKVVAIR